MTAPWGVEFDENGFRRGEENVDVLVGIESEDGLVGERERKEGDE